MHQVLFEQFVESFQSAPKELILDFDCTAEMPRMSGDLGRAGGMAE